MPNKQRIMLLCFLMMLIYGIASVMVGALLPEMITAFDLNLKQGGLIMTLQNLGGLVSLLLGVLLADRWSKTGAVIAAYIVFTLLLLLTGAAASYGQLLVLFFFSGVALRILDMMLNALMGDLHTARRGFYMNLLHSFFGIGAFCGPLFAVAALRSAAGWRTAYLGIAGVFALVSVPVIRGMRRQDGGSPASGNAAAELKRKHETETGFLKVPSNVSPANEQVSFLRRLAILAPAGLGLFFYGMHQSGVTAWLPYYMHAGLGSDAAAAGGTLSVYWAGIIISRLAASRLSACRGPVFLIAAGSLLGGVSLACGLLIAGPLLVVAASLLSGIFSGAVIPLFLSFVHDRFPANTGAATATVMVFMLAGRLLAPWLMGAIADTGHQRGSMLVAAAALVLCAAMALISGGFPVRSRQGR